ncbi:putative WRKY transcription factor 70 [Abeliophyllum distichum]|uniref:WRKY transcription factor 70 n=1 Tax=Abeliophyllum distichum TaxID=126358 RepID=A0ABD1UQX1_9LAMI
MSTFSETLITKRKRLIGELVKVKNIAAQFQTLLHKPLKNNGFVSAEDLVVKILRSFIVSLFVLSSNETSQIYGGDGDGGATGASACSEESEKNPARLKDRRGCYKRRMTAESRKTVSPTMEDGYAWRKEKNSQFRISKVMNVCLPGYNSRTGYTSESTYCPNNITERENLEEQKEREKMLEL